MSRFSDLVEEIAAVFPTAGETTFLVGEEHLATNQNHNRIVAYHGDGEIKSRPMGGIDKSDEWLWNRYVPVTFAIWASSRNQAENRLHALLVALYQILGDSVIGMSNVRERWLMKGIANAGRAVDVTCTISFPVFASDANCVQADAEPGAGFATVVATSVTLNSKNEATSLPPVVITES